MDYSFGIENINETNYEVLKVISDEPIDLTPGFNTFSTDIEVTGTTITDMFYADKKIREKSDGVRYYAWYIISSHSRYVEPESSKYRLVSTELKTIENALCDESADVSDSLRDIENAICELSEQLSTM